MNLNLCSSPAPKDAGVGRSILIFISILFTNLIIKNLVINKGYNIVDKHIPSYKYKKINAPRSAGNYNLF